MQFDTHKNSSIQSPQNRRPVDYSSTSVRLRLVSLIAALGLVFLAMNEAGKPETWKMLGFENDAPDSASVTMDSSKTISVENENHPRQTTSRGWLSNQFTRLSMDELTAIHGLLFPDESKINSEPAVLNRAIQRLSDHDFEEQLELSESEISVQDLIRRIRGHDHRKKIELTFAQSKTVKKAIMDRALDFVEDRSSMNRKTERLAWNLTWQALAVQHSDEEETSIEYLQLAGQPEAYRGKKIQFHAEIRGLQKIPLSKNHQLGIDAYYVFWMKPSNSGHTPYCVYSGSLPEDMEDPGNSFVKMNKNVMVSGRFFKLRSYEATNQQVEICPLIIGSHIEPIVDASVAEAVPWQPPRWLFLTFMICMPMVAITMAYTVYQSTKTRQRQHETSSVSVSLKSLADDESIKSDRESIDELYDSKK